MGVHVLRNLWDGVASPGFREAHIFATALAVILIEQMRADISKQERDYQCKMPDRDTKYAADRGHHMLSVKFHLEPLELGESQEIRRF